MSISPIWLLFFLVLKLVVWKRLPGDLHIQNAKRILVSNCVILNVSCYCNCVIRVEGN